ncbi:NTF2- export protein 2 [Gonapodya sp. JEL0774]|nr:NTF2- export protein 2 [Gonapodya sp. JEL0774]
MSGRPRHQLPKAPGHTNQNLPPDIKAFIETSSQTADVFVSSFYEAFDNDKPSVERFFRPNSQLIWNGNHFQFSREVLQQLFLKLPSSKHEVQSYDCQPVIGPERSITLVVNGTVQYGKDNLKAFTQSFLLDPVPEPNNAGSSYYVAVDNFRFV